MAALRSPVELCRTRLEFARFCGLSANQKQMGLPSYDPLVAIPFQFVAYRTLQMVTKDTI